jgi:hypothetical protein
MPPLSGRDSLGPFTDTDSLGEQPGRVYRFVSAPHLSPREGASVRIIPRRHYATPLGSHVDCCLQKQFLQGGRGLPFLSSTSVGSEYWRHKSGSVSLLLT